MPQLREESPEAQDAEDAGFGSVEAMRKQLGDWEAPGWLTQEAPNPEAPNHAPHESKARGSGRGTDLPPAANATSIFQRTIEKLSVFVERLSLRNEQRQGARFVVTYAKPLLEAPEPGEDYGYLESPPTGLEL
jgi:hypothetical protein